MDPITLIITALATGAAAGLKDMPKKIITDTYEGLKTLIKDKYKGRTAKAISDLEEKPASEARKAVVREELEEAGIGQGREELQEVLRQAKAVLQAVERHAPEAASEAGVLLENLRAGANINIRDIEFEGSFIFRDSEAEEDISVEGIRVSRADPIQEDDPGP